ncbi:MAG: hypothetical protein RLZZ175_725 [Bacteroidota bacterium]|jgi:uncharacterized SAM-binding protein YcdF (DUF218 family)
MKKWYKILIFSTIAFAIFFIFNAILIFKFSHQYYETKSDVAIVLGAGTANGKISKIFRERINHSKYLFDKHLVDKIIVTGGFGVGQKYAESEIAKRYLISQGVPENVILIEKHSKYTIENLIEAKKIMDSLGYKSALLVSDPLHMKRASNFAKNLNINSLPSPTKTTMYRSFSTKFKSIFYETFYYTCGEIVSVWN